MKIARRLPTVKDLVSSKASAIRRRRRRGSRQASRPSRRPARRLARLQAPGSLTALKAFRRGRGCVSGPEFGSVDLTEARVAAGARGSRRRRRRRRPGRADCGGDVGSRYLQNAP
ncbi:hypothetical protein ACP70R_028713 [Stipagrostis hirtigluma subsp. patula]